MERVDIEMLVEDGLEIDFGLGIAQHEQAPRKDVTSGASLKAAALAASPRQAPSEINYDSDAQDSVDTDAQDSVDADAPPAQIPTTTTSSGLGNTNDEITWDDPEDDVQLPNVAVEFDEDINDVQGGAGAAQEDEGQEGAFHAVCPPAVESSVQYVEQDGLEVHDDAVNVEQYEGDYQYSHDGSDILTGADVDEISQDDLVDEVQEGYPDEADNHSDAPVIEINDNNSAEDEEATHDEAPTAETDEADYDDIEVDLSPPEVHVRFAGNDYLLFRDAHDPSRQHILEDSYVQAKASDFLEALHDSLGDEIADGDELIVQVEDLCLEISPMMVSTLQLMSISDFVHLHAKLVSNDGIQEHTPLRLTIVSRPAFSFRYQELLAGVSQGVGISQLSRPFDTGQGLLYRSPVKVEAQDDTEYIDGGLEYEPSPDAEEADDAGASLDASAASDGNDDHYLAPDEEYPEEQDEYDESDCHDGNKEVEGSLAADREEQDYEGDDFSDNECGGGDEAANLENVVVGNEDKVEEDSDILNANDDQEDSSYDTVDAAAENPDHDDIDWVDNPGGDGQYTGTASPLAAFPCTKDQGQNAGCLCIRCIDEFVRHAKRDAGFAQPVANNSQAPANPEAVERVSETIDRGEGGTDGEDGDDGLGLDLDIGEYHQAAGDEISWEGDDDVAEEEPLKPQSANSNGKRQHPEDESGDVSANDVKRRRSS